MKTRNLCLSMAVGLLFCLSACTENELDLPTEVQSEQLLATRALGADTLKRDSIVLFQVDPDTLPPRIQTLASTNYVPYLSDNLFAIRNMPIHISTQESTPKYLTFSAQGEAVVPQAKNDKDDEKQRFYIEVLPATAGIPYVIRSYNGGYPLAVGQYSNNPEHKLLYAAPTTTATLPAAAWEIYASSTSGYLTVESPALMEMGSSGSWMDYYYCVWEHQGAGNEVTFSKYTQKDGQEFAFTPVDEVEIEDIQFFNNYASSVTQKNDATIEETYTNYSHSDEPYDMPFEKDFTESYNFNEFKGVNFEYSNPSISVLRPSVSQGTLLLPSNVNDSIFVTYSGKSAINHISNEVQLDVPARTRLTLTYHVHVYEVKAYYEATLKISYADEERRTKVAGIWEGTVYVDEVVNTDHDYRYTNIDTGVISGKPRLR